MRHPLLCSLLAGCLAAVSPGALAQEPAAQAAAGPAVAAAEGGEQANTLVRDETTPDFTSKSAPSAFDKILIQLNWGDDNLLLGAGETRESSPDPNFGRCARTQIDGIPRRDCSAGSSRLGLYKSVDIGSGLTATGALVIGLGIVTDPESSKAGSVNLFDLGSYVRLAKAFGAEGQSSLYAELFPVDARPMVLGFHPDLEWGTRDEFPKNFRRGQAPGLRLGFDMPGFYAFVGAKSALIKSPLSQELENEGGNTILFATRTFYGLLGGFGFGGQEGLTFEANGGFFHKGTLTKEGVLGEDILSGGGSVRLAWQQGSPIGRRIDSGLYQRSSVGAQIVTPEVYGLAPAWNLAAEGSVRVQSLADFERPNSTALETAYAGHLGFKMKVGKTRAYLEGRARSLTFITAEVPGFFPYSTLPESSETKPEVQGLVSVDHQFGDVTVAVTGGVRMPAVYRGLPVQGGGNDPASAGIRTVVVSDAEAGGWYILPEGDEEGLVFWTKLGTKWQPVSEFAVLGEVLFGRDPNRTQIERDAFGHALRVYTESNVLGVNVLGQFLF